jgi:hypothetical protein
MPNQDKDQLLILFCQQIGLTCANDHDDIRNVLLV